MLVEFQRSGGFAGTSLTTRVDTEELPPPEAEELARLVERADLQTLAKRPPGPGRADRFQYDLAITLEDRRYEVTLGETEVPETARPLLDRLTELARHR